MYPLAILRFAGPEKAEGLETMLLKLLPTLHSAKPNSQASNLGN